MKIVVLLLTLVGSVVASKSFLEALLRHPGGIGGLFKGPDSETLVKGPDGSVITSELGGGKLQPQLPAAPVVVTPEETVKPDPQIVAVPPSSAVVAAETIAAAEVKGGIMEQSRAAEASRVAGTVQIPSGIPTFGPIVKPLESSGVVLPLGHSTIAIETVTPLRQDTSTILSTLPIGRAEMVYPKGSPLLLDVETLRDPQLTPISQFPANTRQLVPTSQEEPVRLSIAAPSEILNLGVSTLIPPTNDNAAGVTITTRPVAVTSTPSNPGRSLVQIDSNQQIQANLVVPNPHIQPDSRASQTQVNDLSRSLQQVGSAGSSVNTVTDVGTGSGGNYEVSEPIMYDSVPQINELQPSNAAQSGLAQNEAALASRLLLQQARDESLQLSNGAQASLPDSRTIIDSGNSAQQAPGDQSLQFSLGTQANVNNGAGLQLQQTTADESIRFVQAPVSANTLYTLEQTVGTMQGNEQALAQANAPGSNQGTSLQIDNGNLRLGEPNLFSVADVSSGSTSTAQVISRNHPTPLRPLLQINDHEANLFRVADVSSGTTSTAQVISRNGPAPLRPLLKINHQQVLVNPAQIPPRNIIPPEIGPLPTRPQGTVDLGTTVTVPAVPRAQGILPSTPPPEVAGSIGAISNSNVNQLQVQSSANIVQLQQDSSPISREGILSSQLRQQGVDPSQIVFSQVPLSAVTTLDSASLSNGADISLATTNGGYEDTSVVLANRYGRRTKRLSV